MSDFDTSNVDEVLEQVNSFIAGVYQDLNMSSPISSSSNTRQRRPSRNTRHTEPCLGSSINYLNAEIESITRMCDSVDQDLRSIGVFMTDNPNDRSANASANNSIDTGSADASLDNSTNLNNAVRFVSPAVPAPQADDNSIIDLSETQPIVSSYNRTIPNPRSNYSYEDDDVVVVSANIPPPVVDLCTPSYEEPRRRRQHPFVLSRRRLNDSDIDIQSAFASDFIGEARNLIFNTALDLTASGSSQIDNNRSATTAATTAAPPIARTVATTATTTAATTVATNPNRKRKSPPIKGKTEPPNKISPSSDTPSDTGRIPYACPVCLESCVQRRPTTTKCGHLFCQECIHQAIRLSNKCPLCNSKISRNHLIRIYL